MPILNLKTLWFPLIQDWLAQNFLEKQPIYLVIDRTIWQRQNLIMISLIYDKRAMPIYFELLPKLGSSNLTEQKRLFSQVIPLFKKYKTIVLGDREFCSVKLANWLRGEEVEFCLRLKKNENLEIETGIWQELDELGLKPGVALFLEDVKVTKTPKIAGFNVAAKWKRSLNNCMTKEGWFLLTSMSQVEDAIEAYKKRFGIEEMFRDLKSGGYNLEDTNVSGKRLSVILLICFAYACSTFQGREIKKKGMQKYVARLKELGRSQRRHSSFYVGLYGQTWVTFRDDCWELVQSLIKLNRNKLQHYLRGLRAMELIISAL